jgi:hypothetical protein
MAIVRIMDRVSPKCQIKLHQSLLSLSIMQYADLPEQWSLAAIDNYGL